MCRSCPRPPSPDLAAVYFVLLPEGSPQRGLLVPHHEGVRREKEEARIAQKRHRLVEERGAGQRESCASGPAHHPYNLRLGNRRRAGHARPGQKPPRQVDEHEADKQRSPRDRSSKNKHVYLRSALMPIRVRDRFIILTGPAHDCRLEPSETHLAARRRLWEWRYQGSGF